MIKYLGSKRALVGVLGRIASAVEAQTALDVFTGTTRVAQEFKRRGLHVTAIDLATYSEVLAQCYISLDAGDVDADALQRAIVELDALPGRAGYFTETFCERSRYLQPHNGARVDAIRRALATEWSDSPLYPVLLSALLLAADRVDSTTGLQMAYLKRWSPRSHRTLDLRRPELLAGSGAALRGDALDLAPTLPSVDLAYLDPPYNQHRYFTNYHVWETLVRWDAPDHYGVACKRLDSRDDATRSVFNGRRTMPAALQSLIDQVRADVVVVSHNDESWVGADELSRWLLDAGHETVRVLPFDSRRYVGAQIGVFDRAGVRVGEVSHLRNTEFLIVAGARERVEAAADAAASTDQAGYGRTSVSVST